MTKNISLPKNPIILLTLGDVPKMCGSLVASIISAAIQKDSTPGERRPVIVQMDCQAYRDFKTPAPVILVNKEESTSASMRLLDAFHKRAWKDNDRSHVYIHGKILSYERGEHLTVVDWEINNEWYHSIFTNGSDADTSITFDNYLETFRPGELAVAFDKVDEHAQVPIFSTAGSAGADLTSVDDCIIMPHEWRCVSTGLRVMLPANAEMQIRPRSGLALKHGVTVLNAPGTIDSDYRDLIGVILINHGSKPYHVRVGDRIAQAVVTVTIPTQYFPMKIPKTTISRTGGFGSTGV